jgi:DNA-binding NarL/FixJ family response regulator
MTNAGRGMERDLSPTHFRSALVLGADQILTAGVAALLRDALGVTVLDDGDATTQPDVVVLDATSGGDPSRRLEGLRTTYGDAAIVLLLPPEAAGPPAGAVAAVARTPSELLAGVTAALEGDRGVGVADGGVTALATMLVTALSPREREVLDRSACGLDEAAVARELSISPHTVRTHLRNASAKLGLRAGEVVEAARVQSGRQILAPRAPYLAPAVARQDRLVIVLAGTSPLRLAALAMLFEQPGTPAVAAVVTTAKEVTRALAETGVHVGLVDVQADCAALSLVRAVHDGTSGRVLVTGPDDARLAGQALAAGANGYLPHGSGGAAVLEALRSLAIGDACFPAALLARALEAQRRARVGREAALRCLVRLTRAERMILQALTEGGSDESIAGVLVVSPHTVRSHVQALLRKFDVASRVELVRLVHDQELARLLKDVVDDQR